MKVLVSGGAGFVGSHLSEVLHAQGNTVFSPENLSPGSTKPLYIAKLDSNHTTVTGSILDEDLAQRVPDTSKLTAVTRWKAQKTVKIFWKKL